MEELNYPDEEDDFDDRYADELDVLNDIGDAGPPSKKCLNFNGCPKKTISQDGPLLSDQMLASKKRSSDDMYGNISDDDDDNLKTLPDLNIDILGPLRKRSRHDSPVAKGYQDKNANTSPCDSRQSRTASPRKSPRNLDILAPNGSQKPHERIKSNAYTRPPMGQDTVTVTRTDGQRLYLCLKEQENDDLVHSKGSKANQILDRNSLQLLSIPFSVLRQHVDEERRRKMAEESDRIAADLRRALQDDADTEDLAANDAPIHQEIPEPPQHALWVEKYSPKLFTELLSDDAINRTLLKWLKLWDKAVFNKSKELPIIWSHKQNNEKENPGHEGKLGFKKFKKKGIESEDWAKVDANGHPLHKVALLCGPPGLGKTTLAHVIARHAGYNVVEMNASDDRTADVFKQKIETATQMKSVLGYNERPNCLVIDEIDGAPTPAINVLLSALKQKESDAAKKTKKKSKVTLSRPIICICNDQFVPSLRQLRQLALVAVFPKTIPGRLSTRLYEIAKRECVKTDMTSLLALCDKADNDIRSCLNTLQFVQKRHGRLSLQYVQSADVGQKDLHKNLFTVMQEIFQLPKPQRKRFAGFNDNLGERGELLTNSLTGGEQKSVPPLTSRFHNILRSASSCGQFEKLTQGLFENYLNIKFKDSGFNALVAGTEWLEFSDFIERQVNASQHYVFRRYSHFLSVAFHLLYATPSSSKLSYPSSQYENYLKQVKTANLITTMKSDASPRIRRVIDERIACLELFPLLLEVITPNLRPVNMQLFSTREKRQMAELIDSMIAYNLTYHQERNFEGQYNYLLDPNIEEVVKFPSLPQHKQLPYNTKQLIAREIDLEKMRRAESMIYARNFNDSMKPTLKQPTVVDKPLTGPKPDKNKNKVRIEPAKIALDFFGQPIKKQDTQCSEEGSIPSHGAEDNSSKLIWFKFNEGYSNAVRKNVKIQDLL